MRFNAHDSSARNCGMLCRERHHLEQGGAEIHTIVQYPAVRCS